MPTGINNESKTQVEITKLKNRIIELETHLKESKKLSLKLKETVEKKTQQIFGVEKEIIEAVESYRWKKGDLLQRGISIEEISTAQIKSLRNQTNLISQEISGADIVLYDNTKLHEKLKEVSTLQIKNFQNQSSEREKIKQKDFDTRMAMEEIMRKIIKNSDAVYKQDAIDKMNLESAQADAENQRILAEFNIREKHTESLIHQQLTSFNKLKKLRIEKDVFSSAIQCQRKQITKQLRNNENQAEDNDEMRSILESLKHEIFDLKAKARRKREAKLEAQRLRNLHLSVEAKRREVYKKAVDRVNQLLSQTIQIADLLTLAQNENMSKTMHEVTLH